jgi:branched-chain amino acid transport system ATP-binding protein
LYESGSYNAVGRQGAYVNAVKYDGTAAFLDDVGNRVQGGCFARPVGADERDDFALFPRLKERLRQNAGTLSGGEQQMLAMGRALMSAPRLLLLDEPSMGLSPIMVDEIFSIIKRISENGATILLVEQNAFKALGIASRAYILETGVVSMEGGAAELRNNGAVKAAYLG